MKLFINVLAWIFIMITVILFMSFMILINGKHPHEFLENLGYFLSRHKYFERFLTILYYIGFAAFDVKIFCFIVKFCHYLFNIFQEWGLLL